MLAQHTLGTLMIIHKEGTGSFILLHNNYGI